MLTEVTTREEWEKAAEETSEGIDTIYFPFSIENYMDGSFPESPIRVFYYSIHGEKKYWFMVKDNIYIKPYCMLAQLPGTRFDRTEFIDCLREFRVRALGALDSNRPHLIIGKEELVKAYTLLMKNIQCSMESTDLSLYLFYMNEKQKRMMMQVSSRKLPDGYYMEEIDAMKEAELINSTWKHAKEGDLEQTTAKLVRLPSACVKKDGLPVAFEMMDPAGFFNNQFVFEDHRRKGLGTAVETRLCHKCIELGITPFKTVDKRNSIVVETSRQSPYWSQWCDGEKPNTVIFQEWTRCNE